MKTSWINEERYDDECKEITMNRKRGVDGIIPPNNLTEKQYQDYVYLGLER